MAELAAAGVPLYLYNRENFMFNNTLRLKREFQGQSMRIKQFELFREDVRDLMNLTVSKMDNYLIVTTLQLGFCIVLLTEGRPTTNRAPHWLLWLWSMTIIGAFFYFLLAAWLAIHASIAAHSFGVRMLTQFVRLPVPNQKQLDAARAHATDFEGLGATELLRIPVFRQQFRRFNAALDNLTTSQETEAESDGTSRFGSEMGTELDVRRNPTALPQHIRLYRELQAYWQAYDAYARVCMALGTNQMMYAVGYDVLQMLTILELTPEPALACLLAFAAAAWLLARLDLYLSRRLLTLAGGLLVLPLFISWVCLSIFLANPNEPHVLDELPVLLVFLMHVVWLVFIVYIAKAESFGSLCLPRNFRSVLYLDVFGQMEDPRAQAALQQHDLSSGTITAPSTAVDPRGVSALSGGLPPVAEDAGSFPSMERGGSLRPQESGSANSLVRQHSSSVDSQGLALRPELRTELAGLCWRLQAELERDLLRWESAQLGELVGPDGYEVNEVARLRAEADAVCRRLEALAPGPAGGGGDQGGAGPRAWLKLEWNPSGDPTTFWYSCDSGDVVWIQPREPDAILELEGVQRQLDELTGKVEALRELQPEESPEAEPPSTSPPGTRPPQLPEPRGPPLSAQPAQPVTAESDSSTTAPRTTRTATAASETLAGGQNMRSVGFRETESEDEGPAQETRFGGQEALHGEALFEAFALNTAAGSQTFHPHRSNAGGSQEGRHYEQRRPPGQLPWLTFLKGSIALIAMWIVGLLWMLGSCLLRIDIPVEPAPPPDPDFHVVAQGPHAFFSSTSMACHEGLRSVFVAEKYSVYEMDLTKARGFDNAMLEVEALGANHGDGNNASAASPAALQPALTRCLAQAPDFHSAGLRGIALECAGAEDEGSLAAAPRHRCSALLLGAGGHGALRCPLEAEEPGGAAPARAAAFGGPWRGLVPSRGGEAIWAERERDGALVMLQHSFGTDSMLVPQFEVSRSEMSGHGYFHILEDIGVVLGLQPDGLLRAWPLAGGDLGAGGAAWSLRLGGARRWQGLCAAGEALFFLGAPAAPAGEGAASAAIWRVPLPRHLRRLRREAA